MRRLFGAYSSKDDTEHVAQSVEHLTFNEVVVGSIPTVLTKSHKFNIWGFGV